MALPKTLTGVGGSVQITGGTGGADMAAGTYAKAKVGEMAIKGCLTDVLVDKFPGMNVNLRVYMDINDKNTLFYLAIFSWSLLDFEHKWMPQNVHINNMLENPEAGAVVMSQFAAWDLGWADLQKYMAAWQADYTREEQKREREVLVQMQQVQRTQQQNPMQNILVHPQDMIRNPDALGYRQWRGNPQPPLQVRGPVRETDLPKTQKTRHR